MTDRIFTEDGHGALRFVGDFDGLYADEADPWGQSGNSEKGDYYHESRRRLCNVLRAHDVKGRGLEVGCGHGHVLNLLHSEFAEIDWSGLDISGVAIMKAREMFPDMAFYQGSIAFWRAHQLFDVVILNQMLWYVLESLDRVVSNCLDSLTDRGLLVVSQAFLREQRYGADICNGFAGTLATLDARYGARISLIEARHDDSGRFCFDDGLMVFRKR